MEGRGNWELASCCLNLCHFDPSYRGEQQQLLLCSCEQRKTMAQDSGAAEGWGEGRVTLNPNPTHPLRQTQNPRFSVAVAAQ